MLETVLFTNVNLVIIFAEASISVEEPFGKLGDTEGCVGAFVDCFFDAR